MTNVRFGFDFYGAGNVGDDLMVAGFLGHAALQPSLKFDCVLEPSRLASQRSRFSRVRWLAPEDDFRLRDRGDYAVWLGVGGTPFQGSSGSWFRDQLRSSYARFPYLSKWMVGVGCEAEAAVDREAFCKIAGETDRIWTRDAFSADLLQSELGADAANVRCGGDLAHLSLAEIFDSTRVDAANRDGVGVVLFSERFDSREYRDLRHCFRSLARSRRVVFLANDVRGRAGFERHVHRRLFGPSWLRSRSRPELLVPNYLAPTTSKLVDHFLSFETVVSSRFHGVLAAAWAGCRCAVLGRSSKLVALGEELGLNVIYPPFDEQSIRSALDGARTVDRRVLEECRSKASEMMYELSEGLEQY